MLHASVQQHCSGRGERHILILLLCAPLPSFSLLSSDSSTPCLFYDFSGVLGSLCITSLWELVTVLTANKLLPALTGGLRRVET